MLDKIIICLIAGVLLAIKITILASVLIAILYGIWHIYRAKGGKKPFWAYTQMVEENLFELVNEWIESLFK